MESDEIKGWKIRTFWYNSSTVSKVSAELDGVFRMRIIPETRERIKKRRMEIGVLAACMLVASLYAIYQIAVNTGLFLSSTKVQLIMIVIFAFTVVCIVYFLILHFAYRKRRRART